MTDIFPPEKRSDIMRRIRGKNTRPELIVRKYLFSKGFRFRVNVRRLPGKLDIVLRKYHTAIFVHGCFWHGHENCRLTSFPKSNSEFWRAKITRNRQRDREIRTKLNAVGWNTMVVWKCQLQRLSERKRVLEAIVSILDATFLNLNGRKQPITYSQKDLCSQAAEKSTGYAKKG